MKRSLAVFLLLLVIIAVSVLDIVLDGSQIVLQAIPLCGLAILYGLPAIVLGIAYILLLWITLSSIDFIQTVSVWQAVVALVSPIIAYWICTLRKHGVNLEQMQRRLLEGMRDGVILSGPDGTIHLVNPAACSLLGLSTTQHDWHDNLHEIGIVHLWETCANHTMRAVSAEFTVNDRVLQVTVTPVFEAGYLMGLVTSIADFTSERQLTLMREDFLALVSHELRNPLTSINGFAEFLIGDGMPERISRYARIIKRNTDRMLRLIHDLLQLRSFEVGTFQLQPQLVNLTELIHQLVDDMEPSAQEAGVVLHVRCPLQPIWGIYDPDRILQVIANLIDNAMKFTPKGKAVYLALNTEGNKVLIEVSDCGPGIPAEELEHIFSKYYQVSSVRSTTKGTGLGLAVCRYLVELHDGKIWATSREGEGTSFWVSLDRCTETELPQDRSERFQLETFPNMEELPR
ncbi:MAG TPA: ATP-binding protein [Armatimonadota bacterium]|nr:ATP-binding protein [Armatimonadota bacterium]